MKRMKLIVLFSAIFLIGSIATAQRTVTGTITDAVTGESLIGASILISGTTTGTVSELDGSYSIKVPLGSTTLEFSYTGYQPQTVEIGTSNVLDVQMTAGTLLNEVVVIGYGTVKREDVTGSIQTVEAADFNQGAITAPEQLIAGKVAGVQVTTGGAPGDGSQIRIRGGSSLSASNSPLIVIDGVPVDNEGVGGARNVLNLINTDDIETFTVLKDASSTAIYGSRASNGVIIITTKQGKAGGKLRVHYNGDVSISDPIATINGLDATEYRTLIEKQYAEGHPARNIIGDANTDWASEIYETGIGSNHNVSFFGGLPGIPYRLSLGYTDMNGILKTDKFKRTTAALNLNPKFLDNRLQINVGIKSMFNDNRFADRGAIISSILFDPTQPVLDDNSEYGGYFTWVDVNGIPNPLAQSNPVAMLDLRNDNSNVERYLFNGNVDYRFGFLPELRANLLLAYDYSKGEGTIDVPANAAFAFDAGSGGGVKNTYSATRKDQTLEFYLNYVKEFGPTKLDVMGGYSWQNFFNESTFSNSNISGTETQEGEDSGELFLVSVFGRLNYSILDKYIFTASVRQDATSRFSPDARSGLFPAAAFAWKAISGGEGTLSKLKLRLSYGITGQQAIGGFYEHLPRYQASFNDARYQFGNTFYTTLRPNAYNSGIQWEETTTYNAGLDFGFLDNKITGSVDYYQRETKGLLNNVRVAAGTNLSNFINDNVGELENNGVEIALNATPVDKTDFVWDISVNAAYNENKITKLTASDDPNFIGNQIQNISGGVGNTIQVHTVDFPAFSFLVQEQVYDSQGQPVEGLYVDRNGDGIVNNEDLYRLEKPAPDWIFGLSSSVTYHNFTLSVAGRASVGNYVYNNIQSLTAALASLYHPTNYTLNLPQDAVELGFENPQYLSDHFVQEGSFFRLDHITASYKFRGLLEDKLNLAISAGVQNPLLVTDYIGLDPEIGNGVDVNIYPRSRIFVFGASVGF